VKTEQLESLFEPFVQADPANGQGLWSGLGDCQAAIIAHGGTIRAVNGATKGLTIILWFAGRARRARGWRRGQIGLGPSCVAGACLDRYLIAGHLT